MLFNSFAFIFGFLPVALALTLLARPYRWTAKLALTSLSLIFYAMWRAPQLWILGFSIVFNYFVGDAIQRAYAANQTGRVKAWLTLGVIVDLCLLGWFKYTNFAVDNLDAAFALNIHIAHIALPLAISFFTFQKLAYLIDSARGEAKRMSFLDFTLFASFFPQLIAGPIVHYKEVVPQFKAHLKSRRIRHNIMVGLVMFAMGLFKKTVIADTLASYANPLYALAHRGGEFNLTTAWVAGATFMFQVYFDFAGYSDMAIGLGRMFGIKLPLNFHSPLRASSILDYWRRWHMTLQRFLVAYVYQPLSLPLNRIAARRDLKGGLAFLVGVAIPTMVTFVAVGVWHGAGWTFALYGVIQGVLICINHGWLDRQARRRRAFRKLKKPMPERGPIALAGFHVLTLLAVLFTDVLFRSRTVDDAVRIWRGLIGLGGAASGDLTGLSHIGGVVIILAVSALIVFLMPNSQQIMGRFDPAYNWDEWRDVGHAPIRWTWKPDAAGLLFAGAALFLGVMFIQRGEAVFLYFNF